MAAGLFSPGLGVGIGPAVLGSNAGGFDYYVSSIDGNDSNDGSTPALAFLTLAKLETVLAEGDSVGLHAGSTWREELEITENNVTIGTYGTGAKPLLDGSDVVGAGSCSKTGGQTNVYEASVTLGATSSNFVNAFEDGEFLTRVADVATCDSTAGSYVPSSEATSPITLYIHPNGSTDPTSDGKTYEYTARRGALYAESSDGLTVTGIATRRNLGWNGSLFAGTNCTINNSNANQGNKHNMFVRGGSVVAGAGLDDAYYGSSNSILLVAFQANGGGDDVTFTDITASVDSASSIISGLGVHSTGTDFGTVTITGGTLTNCASGLTIANTTALVVSDVTMVNPLTGIAATTVPTGTVTDTVIHAREFGVWMGNNQTWTITGLTASYTTVAKGIFYSTSSDGLTVNWTDSEVTAANGWTTLLAAGTGPQLNVSGVTFADPAFGYYSAGTGWTVSSDNNAFATSNDQFRVNGTTYTDLNDWFCSTGNDQNSTPDPGSCP
jgi:hypothetical protein